MRNLRNKFLIDNLEESLHDIELGDEFSNMAKNKWTFVKIKNFCSVENTVSKIKRQIIDWDNIPVNHIFNKLLESRICQEL